MTMSFTPSSPRLSSKGRSSKAGFTLLELILAIVVLLWISLATYYSVSATMRTRARVTQKTESIQELRALISLLKRDLSLAFIYRAEDFVWDPPEKLNPDQTPIPPPLPPAPITFFKGEKQKLFFSASSHQRTFANAPENEQHLVTYQMNDKSLIRGESVRLLTYDDRDQVDDFVKDVLIENVLELDFQFWDVKNEKWIDDWDSEKAEFLDTVPPIVKINLKYRPDVETVLGQKEVPPLSISTAITLPFAQFKREVKK